MKSNWLRSGEDLGATRKPTRGFHTIVSNHGSSRALNHIGTASPNGFTVARPASGHGRGGLPSSIRIPSTPENRQFLKLLRTAEHTQWNTGVAQHETLARRLPSLAPSQAEPWLLRILALVSFSAVGYALIDSSWVFASWSLFSRWTKFALGG